MNHIIEKNKKSIDELCKTHHVKTLFAFGSVTRDFSEDSDIDLLYEFDMSGFNFSDLANIPFDPFIVFFEFKENLETLFQRQIDLIPYPEFRNKHFRAKIEATKQLIYAK